MDRSTLSRILLAVGVFFLVFTLFKSCQKKDEKHAAAPITDLVTPLPLPKDAPKGGTCILETPDFRARFGNVGAGLQQFELLGKKYQEDGKPIDLAYRTTHDAALHEVPYYAPLRPLFRFEASETQVPGDLVEYTVEQHGNECVFKHVEPDVAEITHVVKAGPGRYELSTTTTLKNLSKDPRKHTFAEGVFALEFKAAQGGMLSRANPNEIYSAGCAVNGKVERKKQSDLVKDWVTERGTVDFAEISNGYLGQAIVPQTPGAHCSMVAQGFPHDKEPDRWMLRSYVIWDQHQLAPGESATYSTLAYMGPKERHILAAAGGGKHRLDQLIDLGMFAIIAKVLVQFLAFLKGLVGSWGIAIILMTLTVRLALMPLTIPQIRSSVAMRKIKPELDALNKKHEGDQQMKMMATQQLYKKHGINPVAGCLPALLQMPVWFALYTALQTAIELYHEPFAVWHDLSSPDPHFVLPAVLGVAMFIQQKVTPMQMDPAQQKIFTYFMPAMFTVFMLFLPAGLGLYMLTNSVLGIGQTVAVERYMRSHAPAEVVVKQAEPSAKEDKQPRPAKELARKRDDKQDDDA